MAQAKTKTGRASNTSLVLAKGASTPAVRGSNGNPAAAAAASRGDGAPATETATLTTTVSGTITIGSGASLIKVPIKTTLPPKTAGKFTFNYKADSLDGATKIPVGKFIEWAAAQLGATTKAEDLPESLRTLSVAVLRLNFDTDGDLDIAVEIGTEKAGKFDATWKPISSLELMVSDVTLEFAKGIVPPSSS
jgi:hypothetical protein